MERDPAFCQPLQIFMENKGVAVHYAKSITETLDAYLQDDYCLTVLDIQHLSESSMQAVHMMRAAKLSPILAITAIIGPDEKIKLFQAGVHALIEKPADINVCIAQADSLMELFCGRTVYKQQGILSFGERLMISQYLRKAFVYGYPLELTRKEFDLLYYLAQNPYQVFSYEQLYSHIWKNDYTFGGENTVKVHIVNLRKKLRRLERNCIQNEWGIGYRFIPPDFSLEN